MCLGWTEGRISKLVIINRIGGIHTSSLRADHTWSIDFRRAQRSEDKQECITVWARTGLKKKPLSLEEPPAFEHKGAIYHLSLNLMGDCRM